MSKHDQVPPRAHGAEQRWTRLEDYLDLRRLRRRAAERMRRRSQPRTEPATPRFTLGMLPFLVLMAGLAVLAVSIILVAVPGGREARPEPQTQPRELGTAAPGWIERTGGQAR